MNFFDYPPDSRVGKAKQYGRDAHDSIKQVRKYSGQPYWVHTEAVAETVASVGGTEDMIIAALLHDVLEDVYPLNPKYSPESIRAEFGDNVLSLVEQLTDQFTKETHPHLNRAQRKFKENERIAKDSPEAKTIKLADLLDNTKSIVENDKDFARVYIREKEELLHFLTEGNPILLGRAGQSVWDSRAKLGIRNLSIAGPAA